MTERTLPTALTLIDCAMAMDGGSIYLQGVDQAGARVALRLDWSVGSQRAGTTQLYVNEMAVPRASEHELLWLELVRRATVRVEVVPEDADGTAISQNRLVLADDAAAYLEAIDSGPEAAISSLASRLVSLVSSASYQNGHAPPPSTSPADRIQSLLADGKKMEALKAYREEHPDVGIAAARLAVEALAEEMRIAAQQPAALGDARVPRKFGTAPRG